MLISFKLEARTSLYRAHRDLFLMETELPGGMEKVVMVAMRSNVFTILL